MANEGTNTPWFSRMNYTWVKVIVALIVTSILYSVSPVLPAIALFVLVVVFLGRIW